MKNQLGARFLAAVFAVATLASCGGGGGGGGGGVVVPPAIALTAANAQNVAGDAAIAAVQAPDRARTFGLASALGGSAAPRTHVLSRFLEQQVELAVQALQPGRVALAAPSPTCTSGSMNVQVIGSTFVETFDACVLAPGESISGQVAISGITSTASSFRANISINLTFSFTGFADQTFTGNFTLSEQGLGSSVVTTTILGSQLILHQGTDTQQLANFSLTVTTDTSGDSDTVTFTFSSDQIGGSVVVTTLTPFLTTPGRTFPHTGAIQIVGANGSKIVLTVNGDETGATPQVTIQLDADGDGVFELTLNKNWSDLSA